MEIDNQIKDSIKFYTMDKDQCRTLKILMDPINYLEWLKKFDETVLGCKENFNEFISCLKDDNISNFSDDGILNRECFIKDKSSLCEALNHLVNIFIKAYFNYYDDNVSMPSKLYRSITRSELEYLGKQRVDCIHLKHCYRLYDGSC